MFSLKMLPTVPYVPSSRKDVTMFAEECPVWWRLWTFQESNSTELGDYLLAFAYKKVGPL